eukprot:8233055-Pyramimonas_sp.AAC.1
MQAQCDALTSTFARTPMTLEVATGLTHQITAGPWTPTQKTSLAAVLSDQAMRNGDDARRGARCQQYCDML